MAKEAKRVVVGGNIKCRCGCEDLLIACLIDDDDGRQKASFRRLAIHECVTNGNEPIPRKSIFSARHSGDTQIPSRHSVARSKEESSQCLRQNNKCTAAACVGEREQPPPPTPPGRGRATVAQHS